MRIETKVTPTRKEDLSLSDYPILKHIPSGDIVLVTDFDAGEGILLHTNQKPDDMLLLERHSVWLWGHASKDWKPFNGTISITHTL